NPLAITSFIGASVGDVYRHTKAADTSPLCVRLDLPTRRYPMDSSIGTKRSKLCCEPSSSPMCLVDKLGDAIPIIRMDARKERGQRHPTRCPFRRNSN
ncbi:hypothetical protein, partial [Methylobacterium sp. 37f]|uniref:hypothetical protein n=1 Tax=Methylobacterium sp. 37f TaxID=2817058 RepID=UPI001FFD1E64